MRPMIQGIYDWDADYEASYPFLQRGFKIRRFGVSCQTAEKQRERRGTLFSPLQSCRRSTGRTARYDSCGEEFGKADAAILDVNSSEIIFCFGRIKMRYWMGKRKSATSEAFTKAVEEHRG